MHSKHIQHLYWRGGFGIQPNQLFSLKNYNREYVVDKLFSESDDLKKVEIDISAFEEVEDVRTIFNNKVLKEKYQKFNRDKAFELNSAWLSEIANNKGQLRERMTLFWANHFVCRDNSVIYMQKYLNTIREYALGDFRVFLKAISKEPAMLKYLNAKQNRKKRPNENFARELMELFTLGIGNYSEKDVKESARAFTGYFHNFKGDFVLRKGQHDYGNKIFLDRDGNFSGDDVIDIILEQKQCARFICGKIYNYYVSEIINDRHVEEMTNVFYKDYNISNLMRFVFNQDWFYNEVNIGNKIKSPIDFLVGIHKVVPLEFKNYRDVFKIQHLLGQVLLKPPNVAGWKGGSAWIDVNTIMMRLRLPSLLLNHADIPFKDKGDFNDSFRKYYFKKNKKKLPFKSEPNWETFFSNYGHYSNTTLKQNLLNTKLSKGTENFLNSLSKSSLRDFCVQLMSLPEYQMC